MKQNYTVRYGALDGVEAFLSVAQHRSFRRAADELGVTPSAVSQAVRARGARQHRALHPHHAQCRPDGQARIRGAGGRKRREHGGAPAARSRYVSQRTAARIEIACRAR
jgi:hypothetical protein